MIEIIIKNEKQTKIDNCEMIESVEFDKEDDTEIEIVFQIVCFLSMSKNLTALVQI